MKEFRNAEEVIDFAIGAEQEAVDFYSGLAARTGNEHMKKVFTEFAQEEMKHKAKLLDIRDRRADFLPPQKVADLKIAEYLGPDVPPSPGMTYSDALVLAMKKEKNAFRLYLLLSEETGVPELKSLFLSLAMEESKHKLRFELEYDEYILREN